MSSQRPPEGGPTEAELQAYLSQLREAPLTDLVAQAVAMLVNAAQVKLGLPDGRALIDVTAAVLDAAGARVDGGFRQEVDGILNQLRIAQVEAEQHLGGGSAGDRQDEDPVDAEATAGATDPTAPPAGPDAGPSSSGGASRLWVPPGAS